MRSHFCAEFCALCHLILWRTERRVVSTQVATSSRKKTSLIEILNKIRDTDKRKAAIAGFLEERLESEKKSALAVAESEKKLAVAELEKKLVLALAESEKKSALALAELEKKLAESEKKLALAEQELKSQKEIHELHAQSLIWRFSR